MRVGYSCATRAALEVQARIEAEVRGLLMTHPNRLSAGARLLGALTLALVACAPAAAPSATSAPAKPATAAAPATSGSPAPAAASPAAKPGASPAASPAAKPAASPAAATFDEQAVAAFYRGKTVRVVVGYGAGGGYDTYSRLIARYIAKYVPGNPTVIVENMPGAGSKLAYSQIYNALPKDGTVIGTGDGFALSQVLKPQDFDFDLRKWQYVGAPNVFEYMLIVTKTGSERTGIAKFEDMIGPNSKQAVIGSTGIENFDGVTIVMLKEVIGANMKVVAGYAGSAAVRLAMDSGELDGYTNSWDSIKVTNFDDIQNGNWVPLVRTTEAPIKDLPNLRGVLDFAKNDEDRQLLRYTIVQTQLTQRGYVMAPEVPADRVAAFDAAFARTMTDPEFLAEAEKAKLAINPLGGAEFKRINLEIAGMPEAMKNRARDILAKGIGN